MDKKTVVIQFITNLGMGGAETLVKDYALLLDKSRFDVIIVTINPILKSYAYLKTLQENDVRFLSIFEMNKQFKNYFEEKIWNRFFYKRYVANRLLKIAKEHQASVIHAHLEVLHYLVPISKQLKGIKLFHTCHSEPQRKYCKTRWENEKKDAAFLIKHNKLQIIALHREMRDTINEMFHVNSTIIVHNGVDFNKFFIPHITKEVVQKAIGIPQNSFVVGHVGRFSEAKNHEFLVDVLYELLKTKSNAFLLMIGAGELKDRVVEKLHSLGLDNKYLLLSNRSDIPDLLKAMDVFVFPSRFEGLPVSVVEAQASGLRCLISERVTKDCFFNENAIPLSIDEPASKWASVIEDTSIKGPYFNNIDSFDMKSVIEELSVLYL